jgi:hypothetical protein
MLLYFTIICAKILLHILGNSFCTDYHILAHFFCPMMLTQKALKIISAKAALLWRQKCWLK